MKSVQIGQENKTQEKSGAVNIPLLLILAHTRESSVNTAPVVFMTEMRSKPNCFLFIYEITQQASETFVYSISKYVGNKRKTATEYTNSCYLNSRIYLQKHGCSNCYLKCF